MTWWKKKQSTPSQLGQITKTPRVKVRPIKELEVEGERFYISQLELDKPIPKLER